jgi:phytoene dehydrogenase-like protein
VPIVSSTYDAVVVGAGPNGLSAAICLAREGLSVLVMEAESTAGGGCRSEQSTLPGFVHDPCSTVHPLGMSSPFFRSLALERHGLEWIEPPACVAHLLADGTAVLMERSLAATAEQLGRDGEEYVRLLGPFVRSFERLMAMILGPLRMPADPLLLARFGWTALQSLQHVARQRFHDAAAPALLAGIAAHAMLPLDRAATTSFALVLGAAAHAVGWPLAKGGSQAITDALLASLRRFGAEIALGERVTMRARLPPARAYLFDVTPRQLLGILGDTMPERYARRLARFRYGPGVFKLDWALDGPIPWSDPRCSTAGTVHLSGSLADVSAAEAAVHGGRMADRPFTLLVQPSLFDPSRAPAGSHTAWAYCHVPHASDQDASSAIEAHVERFAPGFRKLIRARHGKNARDMQRFNQNYVGGDINGGLADLGQLLFRPVTRLDPYATAVDDVFLCSSSTPPGGGVHGMCGYWAAQSVLRKRFRDVERQDRSHLRLTRDRLTADGDVIVPDRTDAAHTI